MRLAVIPGGWSIAQNQRPTAPGYVTIRRGRCATAHIDKVEKLVGGARRLDVSIDCAKGSSAKLTYKHATAPTTAGMSAWTATAKFNHWDQYVRFATPIRIQVAPAAPKAVTTEGISDEITARTDIGAVTVDVFDRYGNLATKPVDLPSIWTQARRPDARTST